jgi:uncharacterized protein
MERLYLARDGRMIAAPVRRTTTLRARVRGLIGRPRCDPGEALLLEPAKQIHTWGMRFPIDVVFCDRAGRVLRVLHSVTPRRVTRIVLRARFALELAEGGARGLRPGDVLVFVQSSGR